METTYIVQAFDRQTVKGQSRLIPAAAMQFNRESDALRRVDRMAEQHAGVVAVAQEFDGDSGEMGKTTLLAQHGDVPEELLENF